MHQELKQHSIPGNEWNGEKTKVNSYTINIVCRMPVSGELKQMKYCKRMK